MDGKAALYELSRTRVARVRPTDCSVSGIQPSLVGSSGSGGLKFQ